MNNNNNNTSMDLNSTTSSYLLLDLGEGPLSHILTFLDPKDIGSVEQTCRTLCAISPTAWNHLDRLYSESTCCLKANAKSTLSSTSFEAPPSEGHNTYEGPSLASCPRDRAIRFYKGSLFAERMEQSATRAHYDLDDPERCHVRCFGCEIFPRRLDTKVFRYPDKYEYFVRLSYRKQSFLQGLDSLLIWEGFVPPIRSGYNKLYFDLRNIYNNIQWYAMREFLKLFCEVGLPNGFDYNYNIRTDTHPDVLALLYEAVDNLIVTVVAVEWNEDSYSASSPFHNASLVVSTGGFNDAVVSPEEGEPSDEVQRSWTEDVDMSVDDDESLHEDLAAPEQQKTQQQTYLLHPRNVTTHGLRRDEDWIQVEVHTQIQNSQPPRTSPWSRSRFSSLSHSSRVGRVRGISLSHEW